MISANSASVGVLLTNLGSPDEPTPAALRRYLAEFLWDRRVVEVPRVLWWPILHGVVLRVRPRRSAALYRKVWTEEGAPLVAIGRRQAAALEEALAERLGRRVPVVLAMRYGSPSIAAGLARLRERGAQGVVVLPAYPQYSATTTASTFDAVARALASERAMPALRLVKDYYGEPAYIDAVAASIRDYWDEHGRAERLVLSFHGLPQRYVDAGDPYPAQCAATAAAVAGRLGLEADAWQLAYQSRFGRDAWLQPSTKEVLQDLARSGVEHVQVVCPGFAADCLETLEEIAVENRQAFLAAGGRAFGYVPALNDRPDHMAALAEVAARNLAGWLEPRGA